MTDIRLHTTAEVHAIEEDASFSRADFIWGDNYSLNKTVWEQTRSFWKGDTIDVEEFGKAANARYTTSKATNRDFYFPQVEIIGAAMSFMTNVLGDAVAGTVPTRFVDEWIVLERLPADFGWSTSKRVTNGTTVGDLARRIFVASGLPPTAGSKVKRSGSMHAGVWF
ncbi:hypothetical protein N0V90_007098 [Kalmusia sp. IMI 367209]|nr:hypothetical protein N0V90_007098 [Kalmusia sp. IMI 367209]